MREHAAVRRHGSDARKDVRRQREPGTGITSREVQKRVGIGAPWSITREEFAVGSPTRSRMENCPLGSQAEWTIGDAEGETGERAGIAALRKRDERTERHTRLLCASSSSDHGGNKNDGQRIGEPEHEGNSEKGRRMLSSVKAGTNRTMVQHARAVAELRRGDIGRERTHSEFFAILAGGRRTKPSI